MAIGIDQGVNYKQALVTSPSKKVHQGEYGGVVRTMMDTYVFAAEAADTDTIKVGRLPAGAKVINARVFGPDLGATGTLKLGNSASLDGSGDDAAVDNNFITAADSSGQAFDVASGASAAMRGAAIGLIRFKKEVDVILKFNGATASATGNTIRVAVDYVVD